MKKLKQEDFDLVKKFSRYFPGALIMGGSLRDMVFGKSYKDIDIFLDSSTGILADYGPGFFVDEFMREEFPDMVFIPDKGSQQTSGSQWGFTSYFKWKNKLVNLSLVPRQPKDHLRHFDLNCCMITHDGDNLFKHPAFEEFERELVIKRIQKNQYSIITERRILNLQKKYPHWKVEGDQILVPRILQATVSIG